MKAVDVMTDNIISVRPDASVHETARLLLANHISAVLVIDEKRELVGLLSEGDVLRRMEIDTERLSSWRREDLTPAVRQMLAEEFVKSHSRKVADVMTRNVITADPDARLIEIIRLMETNHIKRVPIVRDDKVVGVVSRSNILRALVTVCDHAVIDSTSDDVVVHGRIVAELNAQLWFRTGSVEVRVNDGIVELRGIMESSAEKNAVRTAAEITPGVQRVNDHLTIYSEILSD